MPAGKTKAVATTVGVEQINPIFTDTESFIGDFPVTSFLRFSLQAKQIQQPWTHFFSLSSSRLLIDFVSYTSTKPEQESSVFSVMLRFCLFLGGRYIFDCIRIIPLHRINTYNLQQTKHLQQSLFWKMSQKT